LSTPGTPLLGALHLPLGHTGGGHIPPHHFGREAASLSLHSPDQRLAAGSRAAFRRCTTTKGLCPLDSWQRVAPSALLPGARCAHAEGIRRWITLILVVDVNIVSTVGEGIDITFFRFQLHKTPSQKSFKGGAGVVIGLTQKGDDTNVM